MKPPPDLGDFGREADPGPLDLFWTRLRIALAAGRITAVPRWSRERIESRRDLHLRRMVRFAFETVPFYRREMLARGVDPGRMRTLDDLRLLPVIGSGEMRADPRQFISERHPVERCYEFFSSGSTGIHKPFYYDPLSYLWHAAYERRDWEAASALIAAPKGTILRFLEVSPPGTNLHRFRAIRIRTAPGRRGAPQQRPRVDATWPLARQVEAINAAAPDVISGKALTLAHIYERAHRQGVPLHRPRLFIPHSEGLPDETRRFFEETLGVPIYMLYSSVEARKIGYECQRRDGYHIHEDICPVRILDEAGNALPAGRPGRVVISNLMNRGSVLLNFDTGDTGRLDDTPCPCGRRLHRLRLDISRTMPPLVEPLEGRIIPYTAFAPWLRDREGLDRVQFLLDGPDRVTLALTVRDPDAARQWLPGALEAMRREVTGPGLLLEAELLDRPATNAEGKALSVIVRRLPTA